MKKTLAATFATLAIAGTALGMSHASATTTSPRLAYDVSHSSIAPTRVLLAQGDGNDLLKNIDWVSWQNNGAVGTAVRSTNDCKPSCSAGHFHDTARQSISVTTVSPATNHFTKVYVGGKLVATLR